MREWLEVAGVNDSIVGESVGEREREELCCVSGIGILYQCCFTFVAEANQWITNAL